MTANAYIIRMEPLAEHLKRRHLNRSLHTVWINELDRVVTFPLWNLSGQLIGYQTYRPEGSKKKFNNPLEGRYFTRVKEQKVGVWGLESWGLSNTLYITEGVFDAARLTNAGLSAIALCSNDPSKQVKNWLWTVRQTRPVVAVLDGDTAGQKLRKSAIQSFTCPQGEDVSSLSPDIFQLLLHEIS